MQAGCTQRPAAVAPRRCSAPPLSADCQPACLPLCLTAPILQIPKDPIGTVRSSLLPLPATAASCLACRQAPLHSLRMAALKALCLPACLPALPWLQSEAAYCKAVLADTEELQEQVGAWVGEC